MQVDLKMAMEGWKSISQPTCVGYVSTCVRFKSTCVRLMSTCVSLISTQVD